MATNAQLIPFPSGLITLVQGTYDLRAQLIPFPSGLITLGSAYTYRYAQTVPLPGGLINTTTAYVVRAGGLIPLGGQQVLGQPPGIKAPSGIIAWPQYANTGVKYFVELSEAWSTWTDSIAIRFNADIFLSETWTPFSDTLTITYHAIVSGLTETVVITENFSSGGGTNYIANLNETWTTFTESLSANYNAVAHLSETWTTYTESLAVGVAFIVPMAETWTPFTEALHITYGAVVPLAETDTITESLTAGANTTVSLSETDAWSESLGVLASHFASMSESWTVFTDAFSETIGEHLSETVTVSEAQTISAGYQTPLAETVPISESLAVQTDFVVNLAETWTTFTESIFLLQTMYLAETVPISEALVVDQGEFTGISESWPTIGEVITINQGFVVELTETVPWSESLATQANCSLLLSETVTISEILSGDSITLFEVVRWLEALTIGEQMEKPLVFKSDTDPATAYPQPIDTNVDGIGAAVFYPQSTTSNDENVGFGRDSSNNGTFFDPKWAYTARMIDWLLQGDPVGVNLTCNLTYSGSNVTKQVWTITATTKKILEVDFTYSGSDIATEVRKVYGPDGSTIVAQTTTTNTYSLGLLQSFTQTRDV